MSIDARIEKLDHRHSDLEARIAEEMKHPAHDPMKVSVLKKQKLRLKEEMRTLKRQN